MKRFLISFAIGLAASSLLTGLFAVLAHRSKSRELERLSGEVLVLVTTRDLAEGSLLEEDAVAELKLPEEYLSESFLRSGDRALVVGKRVQHPLQNGDPLFWSHFVPQQGWKEEAECVTAAQPVLEESDRQALDEVAAEIAEKLGAEEPGAEGDLAWEPPPAGGAAVIVVRRDVAEGETIAREDLAVRLMPASLVTPSVVRVEQAERIAGTVANAPMLAGDPLLWQQLDVPEQIGTTVGCLLKVGNEQDDRRKKLAADLAARFFAERKGR